MAVSASSAFLATPSRTSRTMNISMLQVLAATSAAVAVAGYLFARIFVAFALPQQVTSVPVLITFAICCAAFLWTARANEAQPALYGIGYVLGFVATTFFGGKLFGDSSVLCAFYAALGVVIAVGFTIMNWMAEHDMEAARAVERF